RLRSARGNGAGRHLVDHAQTRGSGHCRRPRAVSRRCKNRQQEWEEAMMARDTTFKLTFWKLIFLFLMAAGAYATFVRFTQGLGASTHLSDQFPWGIWISFDVLCGVMLAAGGFTLTAAVHILNIKR